MDLHGQIMNIPGSGGLSEIGTTHGEQLAYKRGHRDARHAAAELALATDTELAELRLLVRGVLDNRSHCFIPNDQDGLFNWDERAMAAVGAA